MYPDDTLVVMTDGMGGMVAFTANASGLMGGDARALGVFSHGEAVNGCDSRRSACPRALARATRRGLIVPKLSV